MFGSKSCHEFAYDLSSLSQKAKFASFPTLEETCTRNRTQKMNFTPKTCYAMHAFKWTLIGLNRGNAVVLLVTGKFTIKLQMESILWSSFTVVSGKWELCFHGHKLSNSFTVRKIPELPCTPEMFVVSPPQTFVTFYTTITENWRVPSFSCRAFGKDLNPPTNPCFLWFPPTRISRYFWGMCMIYLLYWF